MHSKWGKVSEKWSWFYSYFPMGFCEPLVRNSSQCNQAGEPPCRGRMLFWDAYIVFWLKLVSFQDTLFHVGKTYLLATLLRRQEGAKLCDGKRWIPWMFWVTCYVCCREISSILGMWQLEDRQLLPVDSGVSHGPPTQVPQTSHRRAIELLPNSTMPPNRWGFHNKLNPGFGMSIKSAKPCSGSTGSHVGHCWV